MVMGIVGGVMAQGVRGMKLVEGGKSAYIIYRDPAAAPTVLLAAREVQRIIKAATRVELPIKDDPAAMMICLGNNAATRKAGVPINDLKDDGFVIATRRGNVFIAGRDNPHDKAPFPGYMSKGTLFGAYEFLERVVGVRWLMPGEAGEDVPAHTSLIMPLLQVRQEPFFDMRYLVDIQDDRPPGAPGPNLPLEWLTHNKMPTIMEGRKQEHSHAWDQYIPKEEWLAHPEWIAKDDQGQTRNYEKHPSLVKFCTNNVELVQRFAAGVSKWLDEHPAIKGVSISPSDGGDFCECPKCRAQIVPDPRGRPSYTNIILKFYNDLARIVAQKHPDRPLAGYVYYNYMYPPTEPIKMEPNVWLVWAALNYYGFGLLKPVYAQEFPRVGKRWLKVNDRFIYYSYTHWMRSFNGGIIPPSRTVLKLELPTMQRLRAKGVEMVGLGAWGYGAPSNYIMARQMWDARVNVDKVYEEWLRRAYGPGWKTMQQLYFLVEQQLTVHKEKESPVYKGEMYEVNYAFAEDVYLTIFQEIERLYLEALGKAATEKQKRRIEMFGDNLIQLHWGMTRAGMTWPGVEESVFYRTNEQYQKFLDDTEYAWWLYRNAGKRPVAPIWKGEWTEG